MLKGKGIWIWQVWSSDGGDAARIVEVARQAGLTHVFVKVADGRQRYPYQDTHETLNVAVIRALQAAGIDVWGWQFVYGRDPNNTSLRTGAQEAAIAVQRIRALGLSGWAIDFENTGHATLTYHGDGRDAADYMRGLRGELGEDFPLAGASARFPHYHPNLPWDEFLASCDIAMPQVYWVQSSPEYDLARSLNYYTQRWPRLTYVPLGAAYGEGGWTATPDEIRRFCRAAVAAGVPAVSFWSWQSARNDRGNTTYPGTELWDAIAGFAWPGTAVPAPTRPVWVTWAYGLKLRSRPDPDVAYWVDRILVPVDTKVEALGEPTAPDPDGFRFQRVRLPDGREGWLTRSHGTTYYLSDAAPAPGSRGGRPATKTMWVTYLNGLKLRRTPDGSNAGWIDQVVLPKGTRVTAIGDPTAPDGDGYRFQEVCLSDGRGGWVTHSSPTTPFLTDQDPNPSSDGTGGGTSTRQMWVTWPEGLKFRDAPDPGNEHWVGNVVIPWRTGLTALGEPTAPGQYGFRFQQVQLADGRRGWVTYSSGATTYLGESEPAQGTTVSIVRPRGWLNLRGTPNGATSWTVASGLPLTVIEPQDGAVAKLGQEGRWLRVRTPSLKEGYAGAWLVEGDWDVDRRQPIQRVRTGESPYLYGFHDPYERDVVTSTGRNGWVLFTEALGVNPEIGGALDRYAEWSRAGFGVIVRLNHGYGGGGTIPGPDQFAAFADTCRTYAQRSYDAASGHGCHIWIIGNEMNNPREWVGNANGQGGQPITPEAYAQLFNRVYAAMKTLSGEHVVCPGAVDPYYGPGSNNLDWFRTMLANINELNGLVLHTYTHGENPALITSRQHFGEDEAGNVVDPDNILRWQYYNFLAYRTYLDLIPAAWRDVPVFITETDQDRDWVDVDAGWVRAAYAEINRYNNSPHHQQVRALLLYRWPKVGNWPQNPHDDRWWIVGKGGVIRDFQEAVRQGYRWRK